MNTMSMDEDVIPELFEKNNEICKETCEQEVNNMLPRLQRLNISDDETMDLPFNSRDMSYFYMDINPVNNFKADLITDSNEVSSMFISDSSGNISVNEGTKAAGDSRMSLHGTSSKQQNFSTNILVDIQFQNVFQKVSTNGEISMFPIQQKEEQILDEIKEVEVSDEKPLDLSVKRIMDYSNESETKAGFQLLTSASEEMKRKDPETGESLETINIIHPEDQGHDGIPDAPEKNAGEVDNGIIFDYDSSKRSYSADISSDEKSHKSSGIISDLSPCSDDTGVVKTASFEKKSSRKISVFTPLIAGMREIRQRRFSIFQPRSPNMDATEATKINSSSDEDSKKPCKIMKGSPRCRKKAKSSLIARTLNPSDLKNDEEKRPSPCKRKTEPSEKVAETTGKLRKRSLSEHNSESGEKTHLIIRSKSLSPGSKNRLCASNDIPPKKISIIPQSRKRTYSHSLNVGHAKYRKSSSSSDDNETK